MGGERCGESEIRLDMRDSVMLTPAETDLLTSDGYDEFGDRQSSIFILGSLNKAMNTILPSVGHAIYTVLLQRQS